MMATQTPKPLPVMLAMSPAPLQPVSSNRAPSTSSTSASPTLIAPASSTSAKNAASKPRPSPIPRHGSSTPPSPQLRPYPRHPGIPNPKLRLKVQDLTHPGTAIFFQSINPSTILSHVLTAVISTLYIPSPNTTLSMHIPPTRSVTLVLRAMDGVAYTTGSSLDDDDKQIHLSLTYIAGIAGARQADEICGVLVHEMVHCWQWAADGTAPGGLIEGVADFVRLKAGLAPPHWTREAGGDWDAGYQHTAYFLDWLEGQYGEETVRRMNERLRKGRYVEGEFWKGLFDRDVKELWRDYKKSCLGEENETKEDEDTVELDDVEGEKAEKDNEAQPEASEIIPKDDTEAGARKMNVQADQVDEDDDELVVLGGDREEQEKEENV